MSEEEAPSSHCIAAGPETPSAREAISSGVSSRALSGGPAYPSASTPPGRRTPSTKEEVDAR
eukprot:11623240-Alexandrium_andersonii.AAC.1